MLLVTKKQLEELRKDPKFKEIKVKNRNVINVKALVNNLDKLLRRFENA